MAEASFAWEWLEGQTLPLESVAAWRAGNYLPRYTQAFMDLMGQAENA